MYKNFTRSNILFTIFCTVICIQLQALAVSLQCPPSKYISIIKNTDTYFKDPYAWVSPPNEYFAEGTAPQQGNQILGEADGVKIEYTSSVQMYDLLCFYPSNATTTRIPLPPMTGYIFYRVYNVPNGFCKQNGLGFTCGN